VKKLTWTTLAAALAVGLAVFAATPPTHLPQALEAQRRLVADRPLDAAAQNDLGNLLLLAGDEAGAEAAYERAVELAPDRAAYHYNLALLLQQTDRPGRALEQFERTFELDPSNAWAAYQVGALYEQRERRRAAIEWYGRAFRLDPDLAFPDVNPHVIESELTAEAMIRGYRTGLVDPEAPRIYEEPGRISALLVTPAAVTVDPAPADPMIGQEPDRAGTAGGVGQARPAGGAAATPGAVPGGTVPRRVLTEEDLPAGPANQAAPQGGPAYRPPTRRGGATVGGTVGVPGGVAVPTPPAGRAAPRRPTETPNERVIVPRTGGPFRPGLPSTGSLDNELRSDTDRRT
jgi:hypothetical protein